MNTLARLAAFQRPDIAARDRRPEGDDGNRGFTVTNTADGCAEIWLYDEIGGWGIWAQDVVDQLQQITASTITVRVSSPGGDVFDGIAIANALASHPAHVTVQVDSLAASIASVIAVSAGDRILMAPNSQMMIHNASGGCRGEAGDMRKMADLLDKIGAVIAQAYQDRAGGDVADWAALMDAETWFTAAEAVAAGLADEAMPPKQKAADKPPVEPAAAAWDLSGFRYAGRDAAPAPAIAAKAPVPTPLDVARMQTTSTTSGVASTVIVYTSPSAIDAISRATGGILSPDGMRMVGDTPPAAPAPAAPAETPPAVEAAPVADGTDTPPAPVPNEDTDTLPEDLHTNDPWAALTGHLTTPDPLRRLREATQ